MLGSKVRAHPARSASRSAPRGLQMRRQGRQHVLDDREALGGDRILGHRQRDVRQHRRQLGPRRGTPGQHLHGHLHPGPGGGPGDPLGQVQQLHLGPVPVPDAEAPPGGLGDQFQHLPVRSVQRPPGGAQRGEEALVAGLPPPAYDSTLLEHVFEYLGGR